MFNRDCGLFKREVLNTCKLQKIISEKIINCKYILIFFERKSSQHCLKSLYKLKREKKRLTDVFDEEIVTKVDVISTGDHNIRGLTL